MSTLLDEETVVLEGLDFEVRCENRWTGSHAAKVMILCRGCRAGVPLCRAHLATLHRQIDDALAVSCNACGRLSFSFDDALEVVDL